MPEAARRLGISERAVRKRIDAGTLAAEKEGRAWVVHLPIAGDVPAGADPATAQPGAAAPTAAGGLDLQPLAELIERQGDEIRRLAEAATAWQFRAVQAEERLKQLTAGDAIAGDAPRTQPEAAGAPERAGANPDADPPFRPSVAAWRERTSREVDVDRPAAPWWRRWLGWRR